MATTEPTLNSKQVILKNLYRNGNPIPLMFRNGEMIYRMLEIVPEQPKVLPNKSFVFNYNAKNYDVATKTITNEIGATMNKNMVFSGTSSTVINNISFGEDHISVPKSGYSLFDFSTSGDNPMNNTTTAPAMTIVAKLKITDTSSGTNFICNRDNSTFNYMVRTNENGNGALSLSTSGGTILGPAFTTGNTVIAVWRVNANREIDIKNLTNETSSQPVTSSWNTGSKWFSFFMRKRSTTATGWNEPMACDFYWCYASKEYLTDEEIQQVVDFNEN